MNRTPASAIRHVEIIFIVHVPVEGETREDPASRASAAASGCEYVARLFRVLPFDHGRTLFVSYGSGCCYAMIERTHSGPKMRVRNCSGFQDETFYQILSVIAASFRFTSGGEAWNVKSLSDDTMILRNALIPFTIIRSNPNRCELRDGLQVRCHIATRGGRDWNAPSFISTNILNPHVDEDGTLISVERMLLCDVAVAGLRVLVDHAR